MNFRKGKDGTATKFDLSNEHQDTKGIKVSLIMMMMMMNMMMLMPPCAEILI